MDSWVANLHEELHATRHVLYKSWPFKVVDGVRALKVVALLVSSQDAPARSLPGLRKPPRQGCCRGFLSSGSHLVLYVLGLHKDLHATMQAPPEPWFQCG